MPPVLQRVAGKDASKQFWKYHNESILKKFKTKLHVGSLDTKKVEAPPSPPATPPPQQQKPKVAPQAPSPAAQEEAEALDPYGSLIPFGDPNWYQGVCLLSVFCRPVQISYDLQYHSPYFNETHAALRAEVRDWVDTEIEPYVTEWDEGKNVPEKIYKQMGERGYLAGLLGVKYPKHLVKNAVRSVPPERWDLFHEQLITDELSRCGSGGLVWNLIGGFGIGCPPLVKYGNKKLVERILPSILSGDKRICLAITEPDAGSDVANLTCEAKLSEDGKHYIGKEECSPHWICLLTFLL